MRLDEDAIKKLFDEHSKSFTGSSKVMTYERFERAVLSLNDNSKWATILLIIVSVLFIGYIVYKEFL